jgi:hypothetical protein
LFVIFCCVCFLVPFTELFRHSTYVQVHMVWWWIISMYLCRRMYNTHRWFTITPYTQDNQKVSVHLMITIQITPLSHHKSFLPHYLAQSECLAADRQDQGDTRLTLTPSVIHNSNYVTMVSDWNCLKYFFLFFVVQSSGALRLFDHPILEPNITL